MTSNDRITSASKNIQDKAALIWNVANSLFGAFKPHEYGLVILPMVVINDGRLLEKNLKKRGFDQVWLEKRLAEHGARSVQEVYLLSVDEQGQVYFVPKEAVGK